MTPSPSRLPRWRRWACALACVAGLSAGCATLDEQQRRWIFQPSQDTWGSAVAAEGMDDVWIDFESREAGRPVRLHGLWLAAEDPQAPVLLYLHGARWDVRASAARMRRMQSLGFSVLGIDYRGFGRSHADLPSEATALEDARAAWDWLARAQAGRARYVFGHSLGGAVAVQLAREAGDEVAGLLLEGTFTSMRDVIASFRWGWVPLGPLLTQRFDSHRLIAEVKVPLLVVHGSEDRLIPQALGRALYERAGSPRKRFVLVEGGSHHNTNAVGQPQYRDAVAALFGVGAADAAATGGALPAPAPAVTVAR